MNHSPILYFATALAAASPGAAIAQDRMHAAQEAVMRMAEENLECAAYFDIVSVGLMHSNARATASKYVDVRKLAINRAESLSKGIVNARYNVLLRELSQQVAADNAPKRIDEKLANVSIEHLSRLRERYAKSCKQIIEDPGSRAKHWMEQAGASDR